MPALHFTNKAIADLPIPLDQPQAYYHDTEVIGLIVVVGRTGKTFSVYSRVNGKKRRSKIGVFGRPRSDGQTWSVALARIAAKKTLGKMADGVDPAVQPVPTSAEEPHPSGPTFRDAYNAHMESLRKRKKSGQTIATMKKEVEKHLADWLDRPIAELRGTELAKIHQRIKDNAKTMTGSNPRNPRGATLANRVIAQVSACWNTLNKRLEGALGNWNPAAAVEKDKLEAKRVRIKDQDLPDWYARVQTMRNLIQRDGLLFALFSGLRSEDVRTTLLDTVDWKKKQIPVPDPKGGEKNAFTLPLAKTCMDILRRRQKENAEHPLFAAGDGGYAFPGLDDEGKVSPIGDLRQQVHKGAKHSRFPVEDVHTLRRTYHSVAHDIGISELDRHVLMNHTFASRRVNEIYVRQAAEHLARCQAEIDAALWKRIRGRVAPRGRKQAAPRARKSAGKARGTDQVAARSTPTVRAESQASTAALE